MLLKVLGVIATLASKKTRKLDGLPTKLTVADGEKRQVTPAGKFPQLRVTTPARFMGVICTMTGAEKELLTMLTGVPAIAPTERAGAGIFSVKD